MMVQLILLHTQNGTKKTILSYLSYLLYLIMGIYKRLLKRFSIIIIYITNYMKFSDTSLQRKCKYVSFSQMQISMFLFNLNILNYLQHAKYCKYC